MAAREPDAPSSDVQGDPPRDAPPVVAGVTDYFKPRTDTEERIPRSKRERISYRERLRRPRGGSAWPR